MATISENLQTIIDIKADIKTAIENKGVTVGNASFNEYAGKIDSIEHSIIKVSDYGIALSNSTFNNVPAFINLDGIDNFNNYFLNCYNLQALPLIDMSNCRYCVEPFYNCVSLTNIAGLTNLGQNLLNHDTTEPKPNDTWVNSVSFGSCPLTAQSCLNIFNSIYDMNLLDAAGQLKLRFNSNTFNLLSSEDIAIATNKGWTVTTA